jgi:hypothetical protein
MSGSIKSGSLITFTIKVSGSVIKDIYQVFSVLVQKNANRIASAIVTCFGLME